MARKKTHTIVTVDEPVLLLEVPTNEILEPLLEPVSIDQLHQRLLHVEATLASLILEGKSSNDKEIKPTHICVIHP